MADVFDQASDLEAHQLAQALRAQASAAAGAQRLQAQGYCLNPRCGEEFAQDSAQLFCGPHCAGEHKRLTKN